MQSDPPGIGLVVAILVLGSSVSIMSTDMYAPSLPDLVTWFETTPTRVQLTISLNLLAFGLAQLVHGPLSDRFGRRPVMLGSLLAVAALSVACTFAQTIDQMIVLRVLLGIAAAAEAVLGLAILKDLYDERQQVKALALLGMVIAVAPAVAPILGGFLHVAFGWQSNFYAISAMGLFAFAIVALRLPESTPARSARARAAARPVGLRGAPSRRGLRGVLGDARALARADLRLHHGRPVRADRQPRGRDGTVRVLPGEHRASVLPRQRARLAACRSLGRGKYARARRRADRGGGRSCCPSSCWGGFLTPVTFAASYSIMTFGMGSVFAVAPSRAMRGGERTVGHRVGAPERHRADHGGDRRPSS